MNSRTTITTLIRALSCFFFLASCKEERTPITLPSVTYQNVQRTDVTIDRLFPGVASSSLNSTLSFRVKGSIQHFNVSVGDKVVEGQLLATLDPIDYTIAIEEEEASRLQAVAQLRKADGDYQRTRELYESKSASRAELDAARANKESAAAALTVAEKKVEAARLDLAYTQLKSPANGWIAETFAGSNENVSSGQNILRLIGDKEMEVEVAIPEAFIADIHPSFPASVTFDALPNEKFGAYVRSVGATTTSFTTYPATVRLLADDPRILSGMAAQVTIQFHNRDGHLFLVPLSIISHKRDKNYLFLYHPSDDGTGVVQEQEVTVGRLFLEEIEIISGLSDDDKIVTSGIRRLTNGQRVIPLMNPFYGEIK